ncbi:hypothetical protein HPB52_010413 [Rhipicephalus sanguineus]|uniref:Uncharacterized protein n=1 Tax=Rhipicephalus sanguineus TaxID=34632 RepID=A0A9D4T9D1_RHISA|nr:hypothetical protein HPB52_010413 [Rhipicephalus sanguineus]
MRRDCKVPRCSDCHSFGHERDECTRSYARAAGRQSEIQQSELIMDEEESEQASVPATPQKLTSSDDAAVMSDIKALSTTPDTNIEQRKETAVATESDAAPLEAKRLEIWVSQLKPTWRKETKRCPTTVIVAQTRRRPSKLDVSTIDPPWTTIAQQVKVQGSGPGPAYRSRR